MDNLSPEQFEGIFEQSFRLECHNTFAHLEWDWQLDKVVCTETHRHLACTILNICWTREAAIEAGKTLAKSVDEADEALFQDRDVQLDRYTEKVLIDDDGWTQKHETKEFFRLMERPVGSSRSYRPITPVDPVTLGIYRGRWGDQALTDDARRQMREDWKALETWLSEDHAFDALLKHEIYDSGGEHGLF